MALGLLLELSQKEKNKINYLSANQLITTFNENVNNLNVRTLDTIKKLMYDLEWDYNSMKWNLSKKAKQDAFIAKIIQNDSKFSKTILEQEHDDLSLFKISEWKIKTVKDYSVEQTFKEGEDNPQINLFGLDILVWFRNQEDKGLWGLRRTNKAIKFNLS